MHVITRLVHGGAQLNTILTAQHQVEQGHRVVLVSGPETGPEGSLWPMAQSCGFETVCIDSLVRELDPKNDARAGRELAALVRRTRPQVVHTHTSKAGVLGRFAAHRLHVPAVIHTPHGHVFHSYFSRLKTSFFVGIERFLARLSHRIVALTQAERDEHLACRVGSPDQYVIIPSGVDISHFQVPHQPANRSAFGLPQNAFVVGCVARLAPIKGVLDLVRATARLVSSCPDLHVVVAGDGPQRPEIEQEIASLQLQGRVTLIGSCNTVPDFLSGLDVLVVPSHNEGMGRVAVEGMAAGLPIVATKVGGLTDVVVDGETGILVAPRDASALADGIQQMWANREACAQMGERARERAPHFSLEHMLERLDSLYTTVGVPSGAGVTAT